ncbi:putative mitochondrial membrane fission protein [Botrytis fragariae]|uniref:Mitochondrial fission 1 protein n=1 Tax=Botrytis fragariae TaxID=1964551 RepID=A0A8H6EJE5_9HELO|nr:putative mitochondrial membrane fission protein [Botrytis fragariae]KAF5874409.1 putative mitochondrial membrane fission protein [Botrytis fragariae]
MATEILDTQLHTRFKVFLYAFRLESVMLTRLAIPDAADAESPLKPSELQVLRAQYEKEGEHVGVQTQFNYAWGLIKSNSRHEQQEGVRLLSDIFRTSPERRRECLYYLALGNYKLGNYSEARRYNDLLMEKEPENLQASSLKGLIDDKVAKEGLIGVAILSGVAIAAGVVGSMLFRGVNELPRSHCKIVRDRSKHAKSTTLALRALRTTGLALSLGLTALGAYQTFREAMADPRNATGGGRHLDATGDREVVYCHQCENEWYQDEHGLVCPACEGEIIEIVDPNSDPRSGMGNSPENTPLRDLDNHNPWADDSDPEEADIEEHITHGPNGSILISQTIRTSGPGPFEANRIINRRRRAPGGDGGDDDTMLDFQSMLGNLLGPNLREARTGRSGHDDLFPRAGEFHTGGGGVGTGIGGRQAPRIVGGRYTFEGTLENGRLRPRDTNGPQGQGAPVEDLSTYAPLNSHFVNIHEPARERRARTLPAPNLVGMFQAIQTLDPSAGPAGAAAGEDGEARRPGMPPPGAMGLPALLQSLFNHPNAVHGDAVYSQEAFDQIMSQLMEQHQQSNAPGPAPADAISSLPRRPSTKRCLAPKAKANAATEVVVLPCSHWFHESCANAWLSAHNTCPICRKGIGADEASASSASNARGSSNSPTSQSPTSPTSRRARLSRFNSEQNDRMARNEARLESIRNGRFMPPSGPSPLQRRETERQAERMTEDAMAGNFFISPTAQSEHMPGYFPSDSASTLPAFGRRDSGMSAGTNEQRRGFGSSTPSFSRDRPRSQRSGSDGSTRGEGAGNGGLSGWFRDRWGTGRRQE